MKLYLNGHNYKYAAEQMLLTLFPGERPEYPDAPPLPGEDALLLRLSVGPRQVTAHAVLTYLSLIHISLLVWMRQRSSGKRQRAWGPKTRSTWRKDCRIFSATWGSCIMQPHRQMI